MVKAHHYRMIIDPLEFRNLVDYLKCKPIKKEILINLNRGPKRKETLHMLIPSAKKSTLYHDLLYLKKHEIIGCALRKQQEKKEFYFIRRRWVFKKYQEYLNTKALGSESKTKYFRALDEFYKRIDGDTRDREKIINKKQIAERQKPTEPISNSEEDKKSGKKTKKPEGIEQILKRECKTFGDSVDLQFITVGKRTELGELLFCEVGKIIADLKEGNLISDVLGQTWIDVYGDDMDPKSHVVEETLIAEYNAMLMGTPETERSARIYLCISGFFELLDMYEIADKYFEAALATAKDNKNDIYSLLTNYQVSKGHILIHSGDLDGATLDFNKTIENTKQNPVLRSRSLFRLGEVEVYQGKIDEAVKHFNEVITICDMIEKEMGIPYPVTQNIKADALRKCGTAYRIIGNLDDCLNCYNQAQEIYNQRKFRGLVWLFHGWAEYHKAKGFNAMKKDCSGKRENTPDSRCHFNEARKKCRSAKTESARIRNINRYAHALLLECELFRIEYKNEFCERDELLNGSDPEKEKALANDKIAEKMKMFYGQSLEIYFNIGSRWGIANVFISQYLAFKGTYYEIPDSDELLDDAEDICKEMGLKRELTLIQRIRQGFSSDCELNPISLY